MPARGHSPRTRLVDRRAPTPEEAQRGADVAFDRQIGKRGEKFTVLAYLVDGAYFQQGAPMDVLWDNVPDAEEWRDNQALRA